MIQIDIPMPKNCLECRFSWAGDSCTYCVAQCYHKPGGGYHLHKIKPTYKSREEQDVWREPSCPLIAQEPPTGIAIGNAIFCLQNPHDCLEDEVEDARKMALDAMKALEPIEPVILVQDVNLSNGAKYICGKCGGSFFNQQVNYCPWCGKAVKWDD